MKRVTASEARKNWFRLLDEVAEGDVVVILRKGRRIVLRREDAAAGVERRLPDYGDIVRVSDADRADRWGWEWTGPEGELQSRDDDSA
jgi:antitoxin (DNA-binding transcriptional repressor) of toxin-antitoxin stability system